MAASRQRCKPHPVVAVAHGDVVFTHKFKFPIAAYPEYGQVGQNEVRSFSNPHGELSYVISNEHFTARIEGDRARVQPVRIDAPDFGGLAGGLVYREYDDAVLSPDKDELAIDCLTTTGPIGHVQELTSMVHADCPQNLPVSNIAGLIQRVFGEQGHGVKCPIGLSLIDQQLLLRLQRNKIPFPGRMKIQMASLITEAPFGLIVSELASIPSL